VRFEFDPVKSLVVEEKHGVSLMDAQQIFAQAFLLDQKEG
jgi:uncharacterized DUF497 family protein